MTPGKLSQTNIYFPTRVCARVLCPCASPVILYRFLYLSPRFFVLFFVFVLFPRRFLGFAAQVTSASARLLLRFYNLSISFFLLRENIARLFWLRLFSLFSFLSFVITFCSFLLHYFVFVFVFLLFICINNLWFLACFDFPSYSRFPLFLFPSLSPFRRPWRKIPSPIIAVVILLFSFLLLVCQ